jgi:N-acetylmuramoyl-L-alanine amidase
MGRLRALCIAATGIFLLHWPLASVSRTIAIDVGHSLSRPGATSARGMVEFEFNRALALDIAAALGARDVATLLIGADGMMERLSDRSAAAAGASFLLSVHHDSVQPHYLSAWSHEDTVMNYSDRFSGYSLFVSRKNPALAASVACASAIGASMRRGRFRPSLYHAEPIAGESKRFADKANGVHFYDNLVVLKTSRPPAVLFEAGVIVNRDEELALRSVERRKRMAAAIAAALDACVPGGRKRRGASDGAH